MLHQTSVLCFDYTKTDTEVTITGYYSTEGNVTGTPSCPRDVIIPKRIEELPVTIIGANSFRSKLITSTILPSSLITIDNSAFFNNQLKKIEIPYGVTNIKKGAFGFNGITDLYLSNSVVTIEAEAFKSNQIKELKIPDSVTTIGNFVFKDNDITSIKFSNNMKYISVELFYDNKLESIVIPSNITNIGTRAFASNKLTSVTLENKDTKYIANSSFGWAEGYSDADIK